MSRLLELENQGLADRRTTGGAEIRDEYSDTDDPLTRDNSLSEEEPP